MRKIHMFWIFAVIFLLLAGCSSAAPESAPAPIEEPSAPEAEPINQSDSFLPGTVSGFTYENSSLGLGCYLEGWSYTDGAEIDAINRSSENQMVLDMSSQSDNGLLSVSVQVQPWTQNTEYPLYEQDLPALSDELTKAGYSKVSLQADRASLSGNSYPCLVMDAETEGVPICQKQVFVTCNHQLAIITATAFLDAPVDQILMSFYQF